MCVRSVGEPRRRGPHPGDRVRAYARLENAACAARLAAMADMLAAAHAADGSAERDQWRWTTGPRSAPRSAPPTDVTSGVASGLLMDAVTLRERLPKVAALFAEGLISYRLVHAICTRTTLVRDPDALAALDADLATELRGRGAMSVTEAERTIDTLVLTHDPEGVRRTQSKARGCSVEVYVEDATGIAQLWGRCVGHRRQRLRSTPRRVGGHRCDADPRAPINAAPRRWGRWASAGTACRACANSPTAKPPPSRPGAGWSSTSSPTVHHPRQLGTDPNDDPDSPPRAAH